MSILGVEVPDSRPVFLVVLSVHVLAGGVCVVAGGLAAAAAKRPGRHPAAGTWYYRSLVVLFATALVLAAMRWSHDAHLAGIAVVAFAAGTVGRQARRRRWRGWLRWHAAGMGGSYIALLTGFYVDNGPQLPLWDRLPHLAYWLLPALIGVPLILVALARYRRPALRRQRNAVRPARRG